MVVHPADSPPDRLSDWGIVYSDSLHLELNDRVIPYSLNTPLFTDYALKLRTVWLPEGTQATYNESREIRLPGRHNHQQDLPLRKGGDLGHGGTRRCEARRDATLDSDGRLDLDDMS